MNNKIKYDIPASGTVIVKVVDIIGSPVRVILNEHNSAGIYEVSLDAESLAPGKYYYKVLFNDSNENFNGDQLSTQGETIATGQVKIEI